LRIPGSLNKEIDNFSTLDWLLFVALLAGLAVLIPLFVQRYFKLMEGIYLVWDSIRLSWAFSLAHSYKLYYPANSGPAIAVVYGPLFPLVYCFLSVIHSPTKAIIFAAFLSCFFFFFPVWRLLLSYGQPVQKKTLYSAVVFLCFCFLTVISRELTYSALLVHADALALAMATIACAFLSRLDNPDNIWPLVFSSIFSVLSVWTKQTLFPVTIALPVYMLLAYGYRYMRKYLLCLGVVFLIISLIMIAFFNLHDLWFYLITLPISSPWRIQGSRLSGLYSAYSYLMAKCLLFALLLGIYSLYQIFSIPASNNRVRQWFSSNPWTIFAITGIFMLPTSILGWIKVGGDYNDLSPTIYFLYLGFILASFGLILGWLNSDCQKTRWEAKLFLLLIVLAVTLANREINPNLKNFKILWNNEIQAAYNYEKKHPGVVYFPNQPLSALIAEGKLYHHAYGVFERRICGFPLSREHFMENIPPNMRFIAIWSIDRENLEVMKYFPEFTKQVKIKELPGWTVYSKENENTAY